MQIPKILTGIKGSEGAKKRLGHILNELGEILSPLGYWQTDNLITFGKIQSFLEDERLLACVERHANHEYDKAIIWRTHILTWAASNAASARGDFVECGTHLGFTVAVVCDYLPGALENRKYWCYDLFEGSAYERFDLAGIPPFEFVKKKLSAFPCARLIKGPIQQTLENEAPSEIAFMHLDLNSALAEKAALEKMVPRLSRGAFVILDDYGWHHYRDQKVVADAIFSEHGIHIAELPTGQGMAMIT